MASRGRSLTRTPRKRSRAISRSLSMPRTVRAFTAPVAEYSRPNPRSSYTKIVRSTEVGLLTVPAGSNHGDGCIEHQLSVLPSVTDLTNLYDAYKILWVTLKFIPISPLVGGSQLYTVVDLNDSTPLTSAPQYFGYDNCKITDGYNPLIISYKPQAMVSTTPGTAGRIYANGWIAASNPSVPHYGVKYGIYTSLGTTVSTATAVYKVYATYTLGFKNAA